MEQDYLRIRVDGTWRSICTFCFRTAATGDSPASLVTREQRHRCAEPLRSAFAFSDYRDTGEGRENLG